METITYTIGVAGHIDHGKTTLTKALTGVDTDRLKEEKQRNISIELGFAPLVLPNGKRVGMVDVPGHERFIRQMIAGAAGIDMVLLVVAADEGVMPQTQEHFAILDLLGVKKGIIVLTKADLVDEEMLELAKEDVRELVQGSFLADAPILAVSSTTGMGLDELKNAIQQMLATVPVRGHEGPFRLPVDRVFTIKGVGTVVTGTVYEGKVREGDELEVLPLRKRVKVRQVQVHNEKVPAAFAGQRAALNLGGIEVEEIARGSVLATPGYFRLTNRIDVSLSLLPDLSFSLKQRSLIRLHTGTTEVLGKIIFFDRNEMQPGERTVAQLLLDEEIVVKREDPFILRRPTPAHTLGGGKVIDPYARKHRFGRETAAKLEAKKNASLHQAIVDTLAERGGDTLEGLAKHFALSPEQAKREVAPLLARGELVPFPRPKETETANELTKDHWLLPGVTAEQWTELTKRVLADFHRRNPSQPGMKRAEFKERYFPQVEDKRFTFFLQYLAEKNVVSPYEDKLRLPGFTPGLPPHLAEKGEKIVARLQAAGLEVPFWQTLAEEHRLNKEEAEEIKHFYFNEGILYPLGDTMAVHRDAVDAAIRVLWERKGQQASFSVQDAREVFGLSRKYLVPLLELFDELGWTERLDNARRWRKKPTGA
ncbi:selenocysteine-specific translation elongation factor [Bacillaceae bacterium]